MTRMVQSVLLVALAAQAVIIGQGSEVSRVLAGVRAALGGDEKLAAVKTVAVEGRTTRSRADGSSSVSDFEWYIELPDKFVRQDVFAQLGSTQLTRRTGFNGGDAIEEVDSPPAMGGNVMIMRPGGVTPGGQATPEQVEAQKRATLLANRREFTRLALGLFGTAFPVYPVEFAYGGQAESPDGKADVLDVKHPDGFTARLFVDAASHLPLMLTWMDKEPLRMQMGGGSPGGNARVVGSGHGEQGAPDPERMRQEMEQRIKEAEANRKTVEYRLFYSEYRNVNGVRLPSRIQRMVDGVPSEEHALEDIKVNGKIDAGKFKVAK